MVSLEQRPALRGVNPCVREFTPGHPVVQVDLQHDSQGRPVGHLFIPENKVPPEILVQIQRGQVEALVLNDPEGPWEITDVQLRPESGNK